MINASNRVINRYNKNAKVYLKKWILQKWFNENMILNRE